MPVRRGDGQAFGKVPVRADGLHVFAVRRLVPAGIDAQQHVLQVGAAGTGVLGAQPARFALLIERRFDRQAVVCDDQPTHRLSQRRMGQPSEWALHILVQPVALQSVKPSVQ